MSLNFLYNTKPLSSHRIELRNNQTLVEKILWLQLKHREKWKHRFTRQYSVGPYILDFYCPKARLAIELDGSQQGEEDVLQYDKDRSEYLKVANIKVIRFWNNEVLTNLHSILDQISRELER